MRAATSGRSRYRIGSAIHRPICRAPASRTYSTPPTTASTTGKIVFPMVDLDQQVELNWIVGMRTNDLDGRPVVIEHGVQQTKLRINLKGAHVESAVGDRDGDGDATRPRREPGHRPAVLLLDRARRRDRADPGAYLDQADWKDPTVAFRPCPGRSPRCSDRRSTTLPTRRGCITDDVELHLRRGAGARRAGGDRRCAPPASARRPGARDRPQHRRLPAAVVRAHGGRRDPGAGQPGEQRRRASPGSSQQVAPTRRCVGRRQRPTRRVVDVPRCSPRRPTAAVRPRSTQSDVAVMIPTSGTTGRSKLVMQTHLAYVMAGEGFPYWMRLDRRRPADDVAAALPHQRARVLDARIDRGPRQPRAAPGLLGERVPRRGPPVTARPSSTRSARCSRSSCASRQRADDADNPLRLCYTGPSPERERHLEIEARFGFEIMCGYALSESPYGLIWRHGTRPYGTLGSLRQHPQLGHVNDARVLDDDGARSAPARSASSSCATRSIMRGYYEMPDETAGGACVDGWLRTGDLVRDNGDDTYTFIGRKKEVHPPAGREPVAGGGRGGARTPSRRRRGRGDRRAVRPVGGRREGVRRRRARSHDRRRRAPRFRRASSWPRFKVPRYIEVVDDLPHTPTGRLAKHRLPTTARRPRSTSTPPVDRGVATCTSVARRPARLVADDPEPGERSTCRVAWVFIQRLLAHPARTGSVHACSTHRRGGSHPMRSDPIDINSKPDLAAAPARHRAVRRDRRPGAAQAAARAVPPRAGGPAARVPDRRHRRSTTSTTTASASFARAALDEFAHHGVARRRLGRVRGAALLRLPVGRARRRWRRPSASSRTSSAATSRGCTT